ncbi:MULTISPECIES: hypothetical protein [Brevibacillus]|uniref:hypothetical protein n=1 Tax=Brevibacillus TaxID=55080 RepID=UPI0004F29790|nr:hypothetical protein [Brevibacillus borstelensis]KKX53279.1 hypothetical protein X546_20610 [Brevibacillus borstelensis cifa_chp40]
MLLKKRAERSDKKHRLHPYLKTETFNRLSKVHLAIRTQKNVSIHDIAEDILDMAMESAEVITWLQNRYGVPADHPMRVSKSTHMGKSSLKHLYEL